MGQHCLAILSTRTCRRVIAQGRVQNIGWSILTELKILDGPAWQSLEYWMVQLDKVQNIYKVPVISARGCSACCLVGCLPRPVLRLQIHILTEFRILDSPAWQSSEYWMAQLDRVQNTYTVPVISARGPSAHCLVSCQPRLVKHLQIPILTEFRKLNGPAWQSSKYWMAQLDRVQNIGWPSLTEFKILTGTGYKCMRPFSSLPGRLGPSPTYRFPSWQSSE